MSGFNDITSSTSGVWFQINNGTNDPQRLDYVVLQCRITRNQTDQLCEQLERL